MLGRGLATAGVVVILDQLSKTAILAFFGERVFGGRETVTSFFNFALTFNRGISFGLFNGGAGLNALVFSLAAAAIVAVLIYWLSRASSPFLAVAIGLITAGRSATSSTGCASGPSSTFWIFTTAPCIGRPLTWQTAQFALVSG